MNEDSVRRLQNQLRYISRFYDTVEELAVDGIYGQQTAAAVIAAQNLFGFVPTGEADERTLNAINDLFRLLRAQNAPALAVELFPLSGQPLEYGSSGVAQTVLNIMLGALHFVFRNLPEITSIDTFGEDTAQAVALLQQYNGLETTGVVDRLTWNAVVQLFNNYRGGRQ